MRYKEKIMPLLKVVLFTMIIDLTLTGYLVTKTTKLMYTQKYMSALSWYNKDQAQSNFKEIIDGKIEHPLTIGAVTAFYFYNGHILNNQDYIKKGKQLLKVLDQYPYRQEEYNATLYLYNQEHGHFKKAKWWSAMANSSIALAYMYGYKETGELKYKESAIKAMNGVIQPISKNGSALILDDKSSWYLEYADSNSNIENSYFVLNGFHFAQLVIKIFSQELESHQKYTDAYAAGVNAYKLYSQRFFTNSNWTYYRLNKQVVESTHYAVYDQLIMEILAQYDKENSSFFKADYLKRAENFKINYGLEKYNDKILFSSIGNPNPYWIDLYTTELFLTYKSGKTRSIMVHAKDKDKKISERAFAIFDKNIDLKSIEVFQVYNNRKILLYTQNVKNIPIGSTALSKDNIDIASYVDNLKFIPSKKKYWDDLLSLDKQTLLKRYANKNSKGIIEFTFNEPVDLWKKKFFSIFINTKNEIKSIKVLLFDINGKTSERYYLSQSIGNNLILLTATGFKNQNINHNIKKMRFYLYTDNHTSDNNLTIDFSEINYFDTSSELYDLLHKNDINDNPVFRFKEKNRK